ncbi:MAG: hypothetical protein ACRCZD_22550, partial [Phycicoccus sp.]
VDGLVLAGVLGFVASGTKGSAMPPLVAGVALAAVAGLVWRHRASRRVWLDLTVLTGALVLAVMVVFQGAAGGLRLDLVDSIGQTSLGQVLNPDREVDAPFPVLVVAGITTFLGTLARGAGLTVLATDREARRDPALWACFGAALMAAAAVVAFWHPGRSQLYFVLSAVPIIAIGSAAGLARLLGGVPGVPGVRGAWARALVVVVPALVAYVAVVLGPRRRPIDGTDLFGDAVVLARSGLVVLGVGVVLLVGVAVALRGRRAVALTAMVAVLGVAGALGSAWTSMQGRVELARAEPPTQPVLAEGGTQRAEQLRSSLAFSREQVGAARWLRTNAGTDDVVMTNRHCTTPREPLPRCDTRRWLVSAFSERQVFI